jgi:hypothetical protein
MPGSKLPMNLYNFRTFLALFVTFFFVTCFTLWNYSEHKIIHTIRVRLPILPRQNESQEEFYWRSTKTFFPETEIPSPIPQGLPNDDSFLVVSLEKDVRIKLNQEIIASLTNTEPLTEKLKEIFEYRQSYGVYENNTKKVVKAVAVKVPLSAKYGEFLKIVDAVKISGADPIVLQIDELPQ